MITGVKCFAMSSEKRAIGFQNYSTFTQSFFLNNLLLFYLFFYKQNLLMELAAQTLAKLEYRFLKKTRHGISKFHLLLAKFKFALLFYFKKGKHFAFKVIYTRKI